MLSSSRGKIQSDNDIDVCTLTQAARTDTHRAPESWPAYGGVRGTQAPLPTWSELTADTDPAIDRMLMNRWRNEPPWKRLEAMCALIEAGRELALAGVRLRQPELTPEQAAPLRHSPIPTVLSVTAALEELGTTYFLTGSFATAIHGDVRTTHAADLVADLDPHTADALKAMLPDFAVDSEMVRTAVAAGRPFNILREDTQFKVDVFSPAGGFGVVPARPLNQHRQFIRSALGRRQRTQLGAAPGSEADVISAEDLIIAKLVWFAGGGRVSERQWRDVLSILRNQGDRLDQSYLNKWADRLDLRDLLRAARRAAHA